MGVPALFRWLSKKYPKIISPVHEVQPQEIDLPDGTKRTIPVDTTQPNPNGEEMDNLYLDMNGIVHPCSHPEDRPPPANEEEMMLAVFEYTERVVNMVRPRKLLMIAVDGVAPRAKMNQQRSRRFRAAQEAADKDKAAAEYREMLKASGRGSEVKDGEEPKKTWDSNAITPGTPFMHLLAECLRYWAHYKLSTDPAWATLKVIISDASVPGEGEHKIMNFIRSQRDSPNHDPNTRHVMYGLDADLIMLGIATHEPHYKVLREDVFADDTKPGHCRKCNQPGHLAAQCQQAARKPDEPTVHKLQKPFIWLHVGVLREYLAVELNIPYQPFLFDLERALDDWVFMCFFVGNDFLPHLPSLSIREDGIDTLIAIWRDNIPIMRGYVTEDGRVNLERCQLILEGLAKQEDAIFQRRRANDVRQEKRAAQRKNDRQNKRARYSSEQTGVDESVIQRGARGGIRKGDEIAPDMNALPLFAPGDAQTRNDPRYARNLTHSDVVGRVSSVSDLDPAGAQSVLGKRTMSMREDADNDTNTDPSTPGRNTPLPNRGTSGALGGNSQEEDFTPEDTVKLWEEGYQGRYYEQKFHVSPDDVDFRHKVGLAYVEGLCWVLLYYLQGCPSWTWYYPYHYAPFGADFVGLKDAAISFDKGKPFRPYEQLMGVMPARSNHTIPPAFHPLMTDDDSSIKEFYPEEFEIDMNGAKMPWQGVALLPFIDEKRLLDAMNTKYPLLTEDEVRRNEFGEDALIFSSKHPMYEQIATTFFGKKSSENSIKLNHTLSQGLLGKISKDDDFVPSSSLTSPIQSEQDKYTSLDEDGAVTVHYKMPVLTHPHKSMLLAGVVFNQPLLDYTDVQDIQNKSDRSGRSFGGVRLAAGGGRSDQAPINYAARDANYRDNGYQGGARRDYGGYPQSEEPRGFAAGHRGGRAQGQRGGYDGAQRGYGAQQYHGNQRSYGDQGYGGQHGYGGNQHGYGGNQRGYGQDSYGYGGGNSYQGGYGRGSGHGYQDDYQRGQQGHRSGGHNGQHNNYDDGYGSYRRRGDGYDQRRY